MEYNSENDEPVEAIIVGRKGKTPESYKRNVIKKARLSGTPYVNYKNTEVTGLKTGPPCKCPNKCFEKLGPDNIQHSFDYFRSVENFSNKDEQDLFLHGLIDIVTVKRRRKTTLQRVQDGEISKRPNSFEYHVMIGSQRTKVCLKAFTSTYAISDKRVRRIRDLKSNCKPVKDMRGKHTSFTLPTDVRDKIYEHIASFPVQTSHYSAKEFKFLDSELNVKTMYVMFKEAYPSLKVSYTSYWLIFRQDFNLKFGQPQIDTCCVCESLSVKIKSPHLNEVAKRTAIAESIVHKRKAKKYYACIQQEVEDKKNKVNENVLAIVIDYMQNVSLPKIPVQELFYLRQLTAYVFCVQDIKSNKSWIFCYHEGQAKRGPDEVCSFLKTYLDNVSESYDELHVYADNCAGQNKNHAVSRFFMALTDMGRFKKIKQFFPIVGHSYSPCDRDFSIIKRRLRKRDRLFTIHELTSLIIQSSLTQKFLVVEANEDMIYDFQSWWPKLYKKSPISCETRRKPKLEQVSFGISTLYQFEYDYERKGVCTAMPCINGLVKHSFRLAHSTTVQVQLPTTLLYTELGVPLKLNKMVDIEKALLYIPDEHKDYYECLLANSMTLFAGEEDD